MTQHISVQCIFMRCEHENRFGWRKLFKILLACFESMFGIRSRRGCLRAIRAERDGQRHPHSFDSPGLNVFLGRHIQQSCLAIFTNCQMLLLGLNEAHAPVFK